MFFVKLIKYTIRFVYILKKTNFSGITFKETKNVIWLKLWGFKFFKDDHFYNYMALINSLSNHGIKFNLNLSTKVGRLTNKNVFLRYSDELDPFKFSNYTQTLHFFCKQLEEQSCRVYPNSYEVLYWENKGFMTQKFFEHKLSIPKTFLLTSEKEFETIDLVFPYLIKEEHSSSSDGLHKVNNKEDLDNFFKKTNYFARNKYLIAQELLNMRKDLRVILVGDEVVHHYWRINKSKEWKPTATSFGSDVDFITFPEQWREFIIKEFKKLNLVTGAFDIAWQNDDLSTPPLILEVSPNYQPNPAVDFSKINFSYGEYKDKLLFKNSYDTGYIDIVYEIIDKQIEYLKSRKLIYIDKA